MSILNYTDGYKVDHRRQYPLGTELVYSNWTPRASRNDAIKNIVFFGLQYFIEEYLMKEFDETFFKIDKRTVVRNYKRRIENYLGPDAITYDHIEALHDLGYLPIEIKALPEGTLFPLRCPMLTIKNTRPEFFWLTNFLETLLSNVLWGPCTSATTAYEFRKMLELWAIKTGGNKDFVKWQGHDFSFRGMFGLEAAKLSGAAHLLSFTGTDTIPAIDFLEKYYGANSDTELVGGSIPATEHSVMCMGGELGEIETFRRLITEIYPNGNVSIVSDSWDFWKVVTEYLPVLKDEIMARNGKVVIRPDSGNPVKIICGDPSSADQYIQKGAIECMWNTFGGTTNAKGYKELDPHIGLIYGDSINWERANDICTQLAEKSFASTNVVLGIGSFTYQYTTRDTFGFAVKATYGVVNGEPREIFKKPKTDDGTKNSLKGMISLSFNESGFPVATDQATTEQEAVGELKTIFKNGILLLPTTLKEIRAKVEEQLNNEFKVIVKKVA